MTEQEEPWRPRDALLGVLFFGMGGLVILYAFLAMRNDVPVLLWGLGWVLGPILLLIGGNAVLRGLRR